MRRPFYAYTPRNVFGESLVGPDPLHQPGYEIRAVHTGKVSHGGGKDLTLMQSQVKRLNDEHEVHLAYAMHI